MRREPLTFSITEYCPDPISFGHNKALNFSFTSKVWLLRDLFVSFVKQSVHSFVESKERMPYTATCAVQDNILRRGTSIKERARELQQLIAKNQAITKNCQEGIKLAKERENNAKHEQKEIRERILEIQDEMERIESKTKRESQRRHSFSRRYEENTLLKKELESKTKVDFSVYKEQIREYHGKVQELDGKMKEIRSKEEGLLSKIEKAERRMYKAEDKAAILENKLEFARRAKDQGVKTNHFDSPRQKTEYEKAADLLQQRVMDKSLHAVLMEKKAKVLEKKVESLEQTIDMIKFRIKDFYNSKREVLSSKYF